MKSVWLLVISLTVSGCVVGPGKSRVNASYLCDKSQASESRMERLSFNVVPPFKGVRCSKSPDIIFVAASDRVTMSAVAGFQYENKYTEAAALQFTVDGNLGGGSLGEFLAPEKFEAFLRESVEYPVMYRVVGTEEVSRGGSQCIKFLYSFRNSMRWAQKIDYWCWEPFSGVRRPYRVSAMEAVKPGEKWKYDLDKDMLDPFFSSLTIKLVSQQRIARVEQYRQESCRRHKEFYDRSGFGWLAADYPNNRRALIILESCGYDVEVPEYDDQPLIPAPRRLQ